MASVIVNIIFELFDQYLFDNVIDFIFQYLTLMKINQIYLNFIEILPFD